MDFGEKIRHAGDVFGDSISSAYNYVTDAFSSDESTEDYYTRQGVGDDFGTADIDVVSDVAKGVYTGTDGVLQNSLSDTNAITLSRLGRDLAIKAAPGDQRYVPPMRKTIEEAEGQVKKGIKNFTSSPVESGTHFAVAKQVDDGLEAGAEFVTRQAARSAVSNALKKKAPQIAARFATGTAGSGGLAAPLMTAWSAYDFADTVQSAITGKPIHGHYADALGTQEPRADYYKRLGARL